MKRRAWKLVVFLLLGAIVNVAVAWMASARFRWPSWAKCTERAGSWPSSVPSHWPHSPDELRESSFLWTIKRFHRDREIGDDIEFFVIDQYAFGFPFKSLQIDKWGEFSHGSDPARLTIRTAGHPEPTAWVRGFDFNKGAVALPVRPILLSFVINAISYAAILWMVCALPGTIRRRRRLKRGLCPKCAYPIGTSSVCTECGGSYPLHWGGDERAG